MPEVTRRRGIADIEDVVFNQIDRLMKADGSEAIGQEIDRTRAVAAATDRLLTIGQFELQARRAAAEYGWDDRLPLDAAPDIKQIPASTGGNGRG